MQDCNVSKGAYISDEEGIGLLAVLILLAILNPSLL